MAETNDPNARLVSLNLYPDSMTMLNGKRYHQRHRFEANQWYQIPVAIWDVIKDDPSSNEYMVNGHSYNMVSILKWYLRHHFVHELRRILTLERYYRADDDIHYWKSNKIRRADNRVSSAFARYITNFKNGLLLGKPLKYGYEDNINQNDDGSALLQQIKNFNQFTDERHHDSEIGKDCLVTGRGYELTYIPPNTTTPKVHRIDPSNCFVIWSSDIDSKELCAVYYRMIRVAYDYYYEITVYTSDKIFTFTADQDAGGEWNLQKTENNQFTDVPITEYRLNDEREGCFEPVLDYIDNYDKSLSEMEDSEEDFSNATLMITGNVKRPPTLVQLQDNRGRKMYYQKGHYQDIHYLTTHARDDNENPNRPVMVRNHVDTNSEVLWLKPSVDNSGNVKSQPTASYLTKSLDINEWQIHLQKLVSDIQTFTGIPEISNNQKSSGNQTELETETKLMGALENSADFEANFRHGIIRRIKLLARYWNALPRNGFTSNENQNNPTDITVHFDINLPLNVQDVIQKIQEMIASGDVSKQSILEQMSKLDGVPYNQEKERMKSQESDQQAANSAQINSEFQNEANVASMRSSNPLNNASSVSNVDSSSSLANNSESSNAINSVSQVNLSNNASSTVNNSNVDNSGSATSEIMDPNMGFGENGSAVSLNNSAADDMALASILLDSLYAGSGFPSGFDSAMSSVISQVASSSASTATVQSNSVDNALMSSMNANGEYSSTSNSDQS